MRSPTVLLSISIFALTGMFILNFSSISKINATTSIESIPRLSSQLKGVPTIAGSVRDLFNNIMGGALQNCLFSFSDISHDADGNRRRVLREAKGGLRGSLLLRRWNSVRQFGAASSGRRVILFGFIAMEI